MEDSSTLPEGACASCVMRALAAHSFFELFSESNQHWKRVSQYLYEFDPKAGQRSYYVVFNDDGTRLITDKKHSCANANDVVKRVKARLMQDNYNHYRTMNHKMFREHGTVVQRRETKLYECPDCCTTFTTLVQLNKHLRGSLKRACGHCGEVVTFENVKSHLATHDVDMFPCDQCFDAFDSEQQLVLHLRRHSSGDFMCASCGHNFHSVKAFELHAFVHDQSECLGCARTFTNKTCLSLHTDRCLKRIKNPIELCVKECRCPYCDTKFRNFQGLNKHMKDGGEKICYRCFRVVPMAELSDHLESHGVTTYSCPDCDDVFDRQNLYRMHRRNGKVGTLRCSHCRHTFSTLASLTRHERVHFSVDVSCTGCDRRFTNIRCYKNHSLRCHQSETGVSCPVCGKAFITWTYLSLHLSKSRTKVCQLCSETVLQDQLKAHMIAHGVTAFDCDVCGKSFHSKGKLYTHSKIHVKRPLTCVQCKGTFNNQTALLSHELVHRIRKCLKCRRQFDSKNCYLYHVKNCNYIPAPGSGPQAKDYVCSYCAVSFHNRQQIKAHIDKFHLRSQQLHKCHVCGKKEYKNLGHLKEHLMSHDESPRFTCHVCGLKLRSRRGYQKHLLLHSGQKPYQCELCGGRYVTPAQLKYHKRHQHALPCRVSKLKRGS